MPDHIVLIPPSEGVFQELELGIQGHLAVRTGQILPLGGKQAAEAFVGSAVIEFFQSLPYYLIGDAFGGERESYLDRAPACKGSLSLAKAEAYLRSSTYPSRWRDSIISSTMVSSAASARAASAFFLMSEEQHSTLAHLF